MGFTAYNRGMFGRHSCAVLIIAACTVLVWNTSQGQSQKETHATSAEGGAQHAISLAENGNCAQALPLLKKFVRQVTDKELKKRIGLDGIHCAMTHNVPYEALDFLAMLAREFPRDPQALYAATHAYSDLSLHTSQEMAREAPFSYEVHELNAEALELQGKWDEAIVEYRKILDINPLLPGIHARIGRALLAKPQPSSAEVEQAKKNFEQELEIDPRNPTAEYVLGQLASDGHDFPTAIRHFSAATKLDTEFAEAYLGLGTALVASKRFEDALAPLQKYEQLAPDSPTGHYQLALAYTGLGRRDDANREAALQRQTAESLEQVKRKVAEGLERQKSSGADAPPQ
jgi:tetratricopeptide (TPR) repeat protein